MRGPSILAVKILIRWATVKLCTPHWGVNEAPKEWNDCFIFYFLYISLNLIPLVKVIFYFYITPALVATNVSISLSKWIQLMETGEGILSPLKKDIPS